MLRPLEQFICDECGDIINTPKEGYVEWESERLPDGREYCHGFRIVHAYFASPKKDRHGEGCYRYGNSEHRLDIDLDFFLRNVHQEMFSMLDLGIYHDPENHRGSSIQDYREFVDFYKRLTIPYYEEARMYITQALQDGFIGGDENELYLYTPELLERIVRQYSVYP